jgi:hypothetical protein
MQVEISRALLRCTRLDGSVTWQKQKERNAQFFVVHDLTHIAVERELGFHRGFFGLIAEGWEIEDTTRNLPAEALEVERLVGAFVTEFGSGAVWTPAEFNGSSGATRQLTNDELESVRTLRDELLAEWRAIGEDGKLMLVFTPPSPSP